MVKPGPGLLNCLRYFFRMPRSRQANNLANHRCSRLQTTCWRHLLMCLQSKNPNVKIDYVIGTAPELPAKIKAQQMAGNVETAVVFTGYDAMGAGSVQGIWEKLYPE